MPPKQVGMYLTTIKYWYFGELNFSSPLFHSQTVMMHPLRAGLCREVVERRIGEEKSGGKFMDLLEKWGDQYACV